MSYREEDRKMRRCVEKRLHSGYLHLIGKDEVEDSWSDLSFSWILSRDEQRNDGAVLLTLLFHVLQDV